MEKYKIYCLSFQNMERRMSMETRFQTLDVDYFIYDGVDMDDERIHPDSCKRLWSCMYGHLDMIEMFYKDDSVDYGIFCEDDIYIHKDFKQYMPQIIADFKYLNLDVLLLGYMITFKIQPESDGYHLKDENHKSDFTYHNYNYDTWGAQMYMLSKEHAKTLLDKYGASSGYAIKSLTDRSNPFSPDWSLTKDGNRALIMPCIAVEDGNVEHYDHDQHKNFHLNCHKAQYDPNLFI